MTTHRTPTGLMIELSSNSFFDSGSATVKPSMIDTLRDLSQIIQLLPAPDYRVEIEGHTDNVPISTPQFPSNWELSALRSINVLHLFEPKVPNRDQEGLDNSEHQAKNRRVVVFVKDLEAM